MEVLLLCGVFAKENEKEVMEHSRGGSDLAANLFQQKLINGFREVDCDFSVLSAPFIGAYPMGSDIAVFRGFSSPHGEYTYVNFNNVWGIRNFSRSAALKKAMRSFIELDDPQKLIVVYCPHTPFLEAAVYAKRRDPRIRICLYVPDLPQYMNRNAHRGGLYDFFKKYDVASMTKLMEQVDSYILLTEPMKDLLPVGDKPYRVIEGIVTSEEIELAKWDSATVSDDELIRVVYTGKLNEQFGIKKLVDAFGMIEDPRFRLVLCGRGDCEDYIEEQGKIDPRIQYLGQVSPEEAKAWMCRASVLVNPRMASMEYTKYSFPSKNIEYLLSGRPVVAYFLPGMPAEYRQFMTTIADDREESIKNAIIDAAGRENSASAAIAYLSQKCEATGICSEIIKMLEKEHEQAK